MGGLDMWVVYSSPEDYPGQFVVRKWRAVGGDLIATGEVNTAATLQEVRRFIPGGLYQQPRHENDIPCIVEVWF